MATKQLERPKTNASEVKSGDLMAFVYWGRIVANNKRGRVTVEDVDRNEEFDVVGKSLIEVSASADRYIKQEKIGKEKLAELFVTLFNRPFSVNFDKQNGDNRTLRGRLVSSENLLGRSMVEDLDIDLGKHRLRQVDHRTIHWLIVDGMKYVVK